MGQQPDDHFLIDIVQSGKIYEAPLVLHDRFAEKKETTSKLVVEKAEPTEDTFPVQCEAYTKDGKKCKNKAVQGTAFCARHQQYQEEGSLLSDVRQIMRDLSD